MRAKSRAKPVDVRIGELADRQHGVLAYRQLVALGLGRRAIQHRLESGHLYRIRHGVYAVGRPTLTPRGHWMAAVLSYGPAAVLSHHSALALYGVRPSRSKIDVTVPGSSRANRPGIRAHSGALDPDDITIVDGIPVTTLARAVLDASAELDTDQLVRAVEESERRQLFDLRAVERLMARRPHVAGSVRLRTVLADYRDPAPTRSELERSFLPLVDRAGLPTPLVNTLVAGLEVDLYWPHSRLVVELDSRSYHSSPRAFERDRARDAHLLREGIRVLRVTYKRLKREPAAVIDDVRALLSRRAA
jgi:predicted transcriptional regulator of viral defense system